MTREELVAAIEDIAFNHSGPAAETARKIADLIESKVNIFVPPREDRLTLDTNREIYFYENDFYIFSNFSAFAIHYNDHLFPTSEHAYQAQKFIGMSPSRSRIFDEIKGARSAHEAYRISQAGKEWCVPDWDDVKVEVMEDILREKVKQHPYVKHKLLQSGYRTLIENSWRDSFWGWGPDRRGQNMLGKLWMKIRNDEMIHEIKMEHQQ